MENPLLEETPVEETKTTEEIQQEAQETPEAPTERADDPLREIEVERFFDDYFNDGGERRMRPAEVPEVPPIENTLTDALDLYDHLLWQLRMSEEKDETQLLVAEAIVQNLDEDGLLRVPLEDVAAMGPWPLEAVLKALTLVQSLDPPGVGARELGECLRI